MAIHSPRDGGTSDGRSLVVTGRARNVTEVLVTAGEAGGFAALERGRWTITLEHLPVGAIEVCATVYGAQNTATDCITHTVPDGTWSITLDGYFFRNGGAATGSPTPFELTAVAVDRYANRSAPTPVSLVVDLAP